MNLEDLERRLRVLEDIETIKKLKARYCAYCDNNYDADGIASLFTEDAVWDGGKFGRYEGREAIRTFFRGAPRIFPFAIHQVMNPIMAARYEEEYVKVGSEWKFKQLKVFPSFLTPYDQGWVKKRFV